MKKTTLLLLFIWVLLNQTAANAYSQGITLSFKSAPLSTIFKEIEKQTSYDFIYPADELYARKVSISVTNAKVEEVMDLCLQGLPFTYSVNEKRIVVKKVEEKAPGVIAGEKSDPIELTGKVVDPNGKPVEGATITVRGTGVTTSTNADGTFVIKGVDSKASIMVSFVGYEPQIVPVRGKTDLSIKLLVTAQVMKEVIISTGYQKLSKERFVGSYSQLDSGAFHRRAGMSILDRLDGTVTGVVFNKKGNNNIYPLQIRGISTLNEGNAQLPLIVLDNFPMDDRFRLENINPNDVESVTVLKDAAAASIWGVRAGNGVIVITTKKGGFNQPLRASISSNVTIEDEPDLFYFDRISPSDFLDIENMLFSKGFYNSRINNRSTRPVISNEVEILARRKAGLISEMDSANLVEALRKVDIRKELDKYVYRNAIRQQHYLNLTGGNSFLSYQLSLGYNDNLNNVIGSKADRQYTISSNTIFRPIKKIEIQAGTNLSLFNYRSYQFAIPNPISPYDKLVNENGSFAAIPYAYRKGYLDTAGNGKLLDWGYRPIEEIGLGNRRNINRFTQLNIGASYQVLEWLKINLQYRYVNNNSDNRDFRSIETWETRNLINQFANPKGVDQYKRNPIPIGGMLSLASSTSNRHDARGGVVISKSWKQQHLLNALLQGEISEGKGYAFNERLYGYDDNIGTFSRQIDYVNNYPRIYAASAGAVATIPGGNRYTEEVFNRFVTILGNASYSFADKYSIYASFRKDGVNAFGVNTNNKWKPLWSTGIGWNISKEQFYSINWLPTLRIRASYGYTGNIRNDISGELTLRYSTIPNRWTNLPYSTPNNPPNANLRWEENRILSLGVDFSVLRDRLSGSIESYIKRSKDLISVVPIDPSLGVSFVPMNYASMNSKGIELLLNSINTKGVINWKTSFGLSFNKTIIKEVYVQYGYKAQEFVLYGLNPTPGKIAFGISSYLWRGLDPETGDPQGVLDGKVSKDYNAIFQDSLSGQKFHGSSIPLYTSFFRNDFSWKGFTLSINITGRFNFYFREPSLNLDHSGYWGENHYLAEYYNRWQNPGDEIRTTIPSMPYPSNSSLPGRSDFYKYSEVHVKRGDNIRLQDIRVSYQWNNRINKALPFKSIQIFFYPNNLNLIIWSAGKSKYDPDYIDANALNAPIPKTWTVGVNVNL